MAAVGEEAPPQAMETPAGDAPPQASSTPATESKPANNTTTTISKEMLNELDDEIKLTCCQHIMNWEKRPIWTPKWILFWFFLYCVWFTTLSTLMWFSVGEVVEIAIEYRYDGQCGTKVEGKRWNAFMQGKVYDNEDVIKGGKCGNTIFSSDPEKKTSCYACFEDKCKFKSGADYQACLADNTGNFEHQPNWMGNVGYGSVEMYRFEVPEDMEGPIYMYYEVDGFHQNHMRYIKSSTNWGTTQMLMTGTCTTANMEERKGSRCTHGGLGDGAQSSFFSGSTGHAAIYKYWHPNSAIGQFSQGCFPWWSTKDKDCVDDPRNGGFLAPFRFNIPFTTIAFDPVIVKDACKDGPEEIACNPEDYTLATGASISCKSNQWS